MKLKNILLVLSVFSLVACSSNSEKKEVAETNVETLEDQLLEEDADFIVDADDSALLEEAKTDQPLMAEQEKVEETNPIMAEATMAPSIMEQAEYTVQKGDTLMLIAFKVWGDYEKWRELSQANGGIQEKNLKPGTVLRYAPNGFAWNPQGLPHLIKTGETLGTISVDKYGTDRKWRDIWDNNKPMIKDPNLIFAGFTLYYIPSDNRDLASEPEAL
ncbi:LysM peptidoglycan-binding domain-containing protein [Halobacteriovorax sp. GB3]|uniref:LysM peptidoglycan-binding domain-containing protein n=1 Tax=Halobacteriovorax sp. GB3 TaxID=2719615 RepID=UPI00235FC304|nr:LysM peptidoglycan-binding domain-containing protein [Halobacteriovorax sp. GB3]MDD0854786.1 LysM peptidoglycan-binding domain-containing protein [Halobacteriovorax sp. GB3]